MIINDSTIDPVFPRIYFPSQSSDTWLLGLGANSGLFLDFIDIYSLPSLYSFLINLRINSIFNI